MRLGVLALQGAVAPHVDKLAQLGIDPIEIRKPQQLAEIAGLIIPGGEKLYLQPTARKKTIFWHHLSEFCQEKPTWGVCAGAILLAKNVSAPAQRSLAAVDIDVKRNGYGRQLESFIAPLVVTEPWTDTNIEGVFIRAPIVERQGANVKTLCTYRGQSVLLRQEHLLISTFHPELSESTTVHRYFSDMVLGSMC